MNRSRLAQLLVVLGTVTVGAVSYTLYAPEPGTRAADLADAGVTAPNRIATCPVRVDPSCGLPVPRYATVRFPVFRDVMADGGIALIFPPRIARAARCLDVRDWSQCDLDPVSSFPAVAARWDAAVPLVLARAASKFVIPDCRTADGGWDERAERPPVDCRGFGPWGELDGGARWRGCNVTPRRWAVGTQCLDAPTNNVAAYERLEDSL